MPKYIRLIIGLVAAPMIAAVGMCVLTHSYLHFGSSPPPIRLDSLLYEYWSAIQIACFIIIPIAIPLYFVLARFKKESVSVYLGIGLIAGLLMASFAAFGQEISDAVGIVAIVTVTGGVTTLVFHLLAVRKYGDPKTEQGGGGYGSPGAGSPSPHR